jgi:SAM-dependent methyltransferase
MAEFDKDYWDEHWAPDAASIRGLPVNPYLPTETMRLPIGTVLDAGCGIGTEALWLAERGWQVTAADISATALAAAKEHAIGAELDAPIEWVHSDLVRWEPGKTWDLVVTNYAHAEIGQLALYQRLSSWVSPGGTLLIVGHGHGHHDHPEVSTVTLDAITRLFPVPHWRIDSSFENTREVHHGENAVNLDDVVVRAHRLA